MAQVTNTLNRWHKVVERIKEAATKLQNEVQGSEVISVTYATRELRLATVADRQRVLLEKLELMAKLREAIKDIRDGIQTANMGGISQRMNEISMLTLERQTLESILKRVKNTSSIAEAVAELEAAQQQAARSGYDANRGATVSVLDAEVIAGLESDVANIAKRVNVLSDEISDLNTTRLTIEILDEVREYVGL